MVRDFMSDKIKLCKKTFTVALTLVMSVLLTCIPTHAKAKGSSGGASSGGAFGDANNTYSNFNIPQIESARDRAEKMKAGNNKDGEGSILGGMIRIQKNNSNNHSYQTANPRREGASNGSGPGDPNPGGSGSGGGEGTIGNGNGDRNGPYLVKMPDPDNELGDKSKQIRNTSSNDLQVADLIERDMRTLMDIEYK